MLFNTAAAAAIIGFSENPLPENTIFVVFEILIEVSKNAQNTFALNIFTYFFLQVNRFCIFLTIKYNKTYFAASAANLLIFNSNTDIGWRQ